MIDCGLVSVIIPTYNRAKTIIQSAKSVLNQTYSNLELIIIDDCSSDDTKNVLNSINDKRLRYFLLEKNSGACVARNKGVEVSKGKIIAFQDSDDEWHPDKLEKQLELLSTKGYDLVSCGFNRKFLDSNTISVRGFFQCPDNRDQLWCSILNSHWISTQTIVCYKYCFDKVRFDPEVKRFQDWDFALQIAASGYKVGVVNEALVDIYVLEDSITNNIKRTDSKIQIIKKHFCDINTNNKIMIAQYYKSLADAQRVEYKKQAGINYLKSFSKSGNIKLLVLSAMCFSGLIDLYHTKK